MELRVQLEKWATQAESADMESMADMGVAIRLLNHGIESLDQLESAKQRELELLAVIAIARAALRMRGLHEIADMLLSEPSQALREHEAKVLEEFGNRYSSIYYEDNDMRACGIEPKFVGNSIKQLAFKDAEERRKK